MSNYEVHGSVSTEAEVFTRRNTGLLNLGHLRTLVAEANRLGIADNATVTVSGVHKSYIYVNMSTVSEIRVRGAIESKGAGNE